MDRAAEHHLNAARSVPRRADPVPAVAEEFEDLAGLIARRDH